MRMSARTKIGRELLRLSGEAKVWSTFKSGSVADAGEWLASALYAAAWNGLDGGPKRWLIETADEISKIGCLHKSSLARG
jgi:hypothetical protein